MIRIRLIDPISVAAGSRILDERELGGRRPRLVLTILVCERQRGVRAEELAEALWPNELPASWFSAVRGAVSKVRAVLTSVGMDAPVALNSAAGSYRLQLPEGSSVDLDEAVQAAENAESSYVAGSVEAAAERAEEAAAILRGEFAPDEEGAWVVAKRAQLRAILLRAVDTLARARMDLGDYAIAVRAAEESIALEPFRDTGYGLLMRIHATAGNRAEALRTYERCRTLLVAELGVDPAPDIQAQHAALLRDEPDSSQRPTLPAPLTSFVGRERELAEVRRLVEANRLVTLTGAGGCGKTRLALQVAQDVLREGTVWFVDLAPLGDPALVPHTVAAAFGVREQPGGKPLDAVVAHIGGGDPLVVLDNCEHLVGPTAELARKLLSRCPRATLLATSREPLGIAGEVAWRVPSLSLAPASAGTMEEIRDADAVRLFCERARAAKSDLLFRDADAEPIAQLCSRLDGIPLALELAASRTTVLGVRQIAERLDDGLRLLAAEGTPDPRHRTLRATVDWSYELLDAEERALLRFLGVFSGGFTLDAVGAVSSLDEAAVIELLSRLVAKSLVDCDTTSGEARYRLLETMRQYSRERLADHGEQDAAFGAHAQWYARLAEDAESRLTGREQLDWLQRLDSDADNLRAALAWSIEHAPQSLGLRLASALSVFWHMRGQLSEGLRWLASALEAAPDAPPDRRAHALWGFGFLSFYIGSFSEALRAAAEAAELARNSGDALAIARALNLLGERLTGDPGAARVALEESVEFARRCGDDWCLADSLGKLGWARIYQGDPVGARPFFQQCGEIARRTGDKRNLRRSVAGVGWTAFFRGAYTEAHDQLAESLTLARALGDSLWIAQILNTLGELTRARGDLEGAARALDEAREIAERVGSPFVLNLTLGFLGRLARCEGDPTRARRLFTDAHAEASAAGLKVFFSWWLRARGEAFLDAGDVVAARSDIEDAREAAMAMGNQWDVAGSLAAMARLARLQHDEEQAMRLHREALALRFRLDDRPGIADSLEAIAGLEARLGDAERAARLLGAAQAQRDANGFARWNAQWYAADLALVRDRLGAAFDLGFGEGCAMPPPRAVTYATSSGMGVSSSDSAGQSAIGGPTISQ